MANYLITSFLQTGAPVLSNPKLEADVDWQDGLVFFRQMLSQDVFFNDAVGLRDVEALKMMHVMQSVRSERHILQFQPRSHKIPGLGCHTAD
jgi:hypothetical protein